MLINKIKLAALTISMMMLPLTAMQNDFDPLNELHPQAQSALSIYHSPLMQKAQKELNSALIQGNTLKVEHMLSICPELCYFYSKELYTYSQHAYHTRNIAIIAAFESCMKGKPVLLDSKTFTWQLTRNETVCNYIDPKYFGQRLERIVDSL